MKRLKFLPSILMLVACVAVLCIGIYAVSPVSNEINGTLTITSMSKVSITGYVNDQMFFSTQKTANGVSMNLNESGALNFDASEAATASDIPQKIIRIRIQNLTNKELGAYFYSGEGLDANNLATYSSLVHEYKIYPQGADKTNPENSVADVFCSTYTYIAPASADNTYDEVDLYANIDITKVDYEQFVCDFAMKLRIEEYKPNVTGSSYTANTYDLVKLSSSITSGETTTPRTTVPAISNDSKMGTIVIPTSVTTVASNTFVSCSELEHIIFPNSITSMANGLFDACANLVSMSTPIMGNNGIYRGYVGITDGAFALFFGSTQINNSVMGSYTYAVYDDGWITEPVNCYVPTSLKNLYFTKTAGFFWTFGVSGNGVKNIIFGQEFNAFVYDGAGSSSFSGISLDYLFIPAHVANTENSSISFGSSASYVEFGEGTTGNNINSLISSNFIYLPDSFTYASIGGGIALSANTISIKNGNSNMAIAQYISCTTLIVRNGIVERGLTGASFFGGASISNVIVNGENASIGNDAFANNTVGSLTIGSGIVSVGTNVYAATITVKAGTNEITGTLPQISGKVWQKTVGSVSVKYSSDDEVQFTRDDTLDTVYTLIEE